MTFLLPPELLGDTERSGLQAGEKGARASGTPFVSFHTPHEMLALVGDAGFTDVRHMAGSSLGERYFADRADGLRPSAGEEFVVATTWHPPGPPAWHLIVAWPAIATMGP